MPTSAGRDPVEPLTRCVKCAYSLKGLPPEHACPECGLQYDGHVWVYRPAPTSLWLLAHMFFFGAALPASFIAWQTGWWNVILASRLWTAAATAFLVSLVWLAWRLLQTRRGVFLIALLPDGLFVRGRLVMLHHGDHILALLPWSCRGRLLPWPSVAGAGFEMTFKQAIIDMKTGKSPLRVRGFFADGAELRAFVEELEVRRKIWERDNSAHVVPPDGGRR